MTPAWNTPPQRIGGSMVALAVLAACATASGGRMTASDVPFEVSNRYVYTCEDDFRFSVNVRQDSVLLRFGAETTTLPQVSSATGSRYDDGEISFYTEGMEAELDTASRPLVDCRGELAESPWMEAALLGYDFRAVGQEPGWFVEIDDEGGMVIATNYGEDRIHLPETPDRVVESSDSRSYSGDMGNREIHIMIEDEPCQDTMSGEEFESSVVLTLDGQEYSGCGRSISEMGMSPLANTRWILTGLGSRLPHMTGAGQRAYIEFDLAGSRVVAFGGCNTFAVPYSAVGDQLFFRDAIPMTQLACPGTGFERQESSLYSAIRRTNRATVEDGVLTLFSGNQDVATFVAEDR